MPHLRRRLISSPPALSPARRRPLSQPTIPESRKSPPIPQREVPVPWVGKYDVVQVIKLDRQQFLTGSTPGGADTLFDHVALALHRRRAWPEPCAAAAVVARGVRPPMAVLATLRPALVGELPLRRLRRERAREIPGDVPGGAKTRSRDVLDAANVVDGFPGSPVPPRLSLIGSGHGSLIRLPSTLLGLTPTIGSRP